MKLYEILKETGNRPAKFDAESHSVNEWKITSPDLGLELELFRAGYRREGVVVITFTVGGNLGITGKGNAVKIFSTVNAMLERYLHAFLKLDDKLITFSSHREEPSRVKLYDRAAPIISNILGKGWKYVEDDPTTPARNYNWVRNSPLREKKVTSTWISDLTYNRPNKTLTMRLSNGNSYLIPGVNRTTFEQWTKAPSKGYFFHNKIKDTYKVTKI